MSSGATTTSSAAAGHPRAKRFGQAASALIGVLLLAGAFVVLRRELAGLSWAELTAAAHAIPRERLAWALGATAASYLLLTLYDVAALRYVGRALSYPRVALTSFIACVTTHNVGMAGIGGSAVRLRVYAGLGLSASEIATVIAFCGLTYWLGFAFMGGLVFALLPLRLPADLSLPVSSTQGLGWLLLALASAYVAAAATLRRPIRWRGWTTKPPSLGLALFQLLLAAADWTVSAFVVWVLLPPGTGFPEFLGVYVAAALLALLSHVPAGLGVFETVVLVLTPETVPREEVLGALLVYRGVYYLLPLFLGVAAFGAFEATRRRTVARRLAARLAPVVTAGLPRLMGAATFVAGAVLFLGGLLSQPDVRLPGLREPLSPWVVAVAGAAAAVLGLALLALAVGLSRRRTRAWWGTLLALAAGSAVALLHGADYEAAALLLLLLAALLPARAAFHRRAPADEEPPE